MPNDNRDFKGVWISKELYLDKNLSWTEKILLVEIDSLDNSEKGCFASNAYLAEFLNVSETRCAHMVSDLKKKGYLYQSYFNGRIRGLKLCKSNKNDVTETEKEDLSKMTKQQSSIVENDTADLSKMTKQHCRKRHTINTVYKYNDNNTSSSTHEQKSKNENSEIEKNFSDNLVEVRSEKKEKICAKKEKEIRIKSASECLEEVRAYIAENKDTLRLTLGTVKWKDGENGTLKEELEKLVIKYSENLEWNKNPTKGIFNTLRNWLENKKQHSENQKLKQQKSNEYTNRNNSNGRNGHTYDRQESDNLIAHANRAIADAKRAAEMGGFDC